MNTLNYGMRAKAMAVRIGCSEAEAEELLQEYMKRYPTIDRYFQSEVELARKLGYAWTILGRRRFLPEIHAPQAFHRHPAERKTSNSPIQGSAAGVARIAMVNCYKEGIDKRYGADMLLQVHDELMFECPEETAAAALKEIKHIMEHTMELSVPLEVSIGMGKSWADAK